MQDSVLDKILMLYSNLSVSQFEVMGDGSCQQSLGIT